VGCEIGNKGIATVHSCQFIPTGHKVPTHRGYTSQDAQRQFTVLTVYSEPSTRYECRYDSRTGSSPTVNG